MLQRALLICITGGFLFLFSCTDNAPKTPAANSAEGQDPELLRINTLLAQDPGNDSLLFLRAKVYYNLEGYDEALKDLAQAINTDSLHPQYHALLADVLLDYGRPNDSKRAIDVLLNAAYLFPDNLRILLKLSEFQLIVRQHTEALGTLDKVLQRSPDNPEAYYMAGRVALDMGDTIRAIASLQKSVQFNADNADAWRFLGRIFSRRGNPLALQYFDNAIRVDSTDLEAREYKAVFYKDKGEFAKAFEAYRDIILRNPDYSNAYFDMGVIYLELDSLQKAYDHFNLAVKTDPLFVKAYLFRGYTAEGMGNIAAAKADYEKASKMSPNYPEPKEALQRLNAK